MALPALLALLDAAQTGAVLTGRQRSTSMANLADRARGLAHAWQALANQRVGLQVTSGEDFVAAFFGLLGAGATVIPITTTLPQASVDSVTRRFKLHRVLHSVEPVAGRPTWPDSPEGSVGLLTSGTTGEPAAAHLSQAALAANAAGIITSLSLTREEITLCVPPFHHAYGLSVLISHVRADATVLLEPDGAFPATLLETASHRGATCISAVPTTWQLLARRDLLLHQRPPSLRKGTVAGGALPPGALASVRQALGPARFFVMYGQTEACARLTCLPPDEYDAAPTSCGRALSGVDLRISSAGEVLARGPNLMDGYLDDPARTTQALVDGWLHTGDIGQLDDQGRLHLTGRIKNMLKVAGNRVAPLHVEAVLMDAPGVEVVAVVGAPDALMGEVPVAFIVGTATSEQLQEYAAHALQPFERPKRYVNLTALPRLPGGKPDLVALKALAADG